MASPWFRVMALFPLVLLLDKGNYWPPSPGFGHVTGQPLGNLPRLLLSNSFGSHGDTVYPWRAEQAGYDNAKKRVRKQRPCL